MAVILDVMRQ